MWRPRRRSRVPDPVPLRRSGSDPGRLVPRRRHRGTGVTARTAGRAIGTGRRTRTARRHLRVDQPVTGDPARRRSRGTHRRRRLEPVPAAPRDHRTPPGVGLPAADSRHRRPARGRTPAGRGRRGCRLRLVPAHPGAHPRLHQARPQPRGGPRHRHRATVPRPGVDDLRRRGGCRGDRRRGRDTGGVADGPSVGNPVRAGLSAGVSRPGCRLAAAPGPRCHRVRGVRRARRRGRPTPAAVALAAPADRAPAHRLPAADPDRELVRGPGHRTADVVGGDAAVARVAGRHHPHPGAVRVRGRPGAPRGVPHRPDPRPWTAARCGHRPPQRRGPAHPQHPGDAELRPRRAGRGQHRCDRGRHRAARHPTSAVAERAAVPGDL